MDPFKDVDGGRCDFGERVEADAVSMAKSRDDAAGLAENSRLVAPPLPVLDASTAAALLSLLLRATPNGQRDEEGPEHGEAVRS